METMHIKLSILWVAIALMQMHASEGCLEKERIALLEIKASFKSVSDSETEGILASWVDDRMSDCCGWERVKCNATTGRVIELSLNSTWDFYANVAYGVFPILDLSLFRHFDELQTLDLSENYFEGWDENKDDHGNLTQLKKLDLSFSTFNNSIFPYLNTLTSLRTLILGSTLAEGTKSEQGLANLKDLEILDLSGNGLNGSLTWIGLENLKNLETLDLCGNQLNCSLASLGLENLKNLEILDLSWNQMNCASLTWLGLENLKNLEILDLSGNQLNGSVTSLGLCELKNLVELALEDNEIHGHLPQCLSNLTHLKLLALSTNQLSGSFSSVIASLKSIEYLSLSFNNFEGLFSFGSLANLSKLEVFLLSPQKNMLQVKTETQLPAYQLKVLTLARCSLHRSISSFLLNQYNLRLIDLSSNKLSGEFPTWLLQNNTKLETIFLMNNSFTGILQLPNSKHGLINLDISNNNFIGQLPKNMGKILPQLEIMNMAKNSFEGNIPSSMGEMKSLDILDLSSNNFSGELPNYFVSGCFFLTSLILSDNNFQGQILPKYMNWTGLKWLYLDNNQFSGKLEDGLLKATFLSVLDISNNKIHGQVPQWISNFSDLGVLLMSKNFFEGNAIIQQNNPERFHVLDISENRLSGPITSSFNVSAILLFMQKNALNGSIPNSLFQSPNLMILDLRENEFSGSIPQGIAKHSNLNILLLRGNRLQGHIPNQLCQLENLCILDLSYNRLNGSIPLCFTNMLFWKVGIEKDFEKIFRYDSPYSFELPGAGIPNYYNSSVSLDNYIDDSQFSDRQTEVELVTKNRHDVYKGYILGDMTELDLSSNKLIGDIPSEIGDLQGIHALNLSNNSLSGFIPNSFSNLKLIESLDLSYNQLIGEIPPRLIELYNLEIFNVSYNNLSGSIPSQNQFGGFVESTYIGNPHLCGPQIKKMCANTLELPTSPKPEEEVDSTIDMVAFFWSFVASYITIVLVSIVILWINSYWRRLWFCFIDKCISFVF